jgi:hypothetical protein
MPDPHTGIDKETGRQLWNSVYIPRPDGSSELVKKWWIFVFQFDQDQHQAVAEDLEAFKPGPPRHAGPDYGKVMKKHFEELRSRDRENRSRWWTEAWDNYRRK